MKAIPLQLLTVIMENGQQGIFVGVPMVAELMELVQAQLCRGQGKMH